MIGEVIVIAAVVAIAFFSGRSTLRSIKAELRGEGTCAGCSGGCAGCGGSGAEFIGDAMRAGADIYLTGDLKYHDFQRGGHMVLADIGHYESEQFAKEIFFRCISEKFSNFACRISETQQGIVKYI